MPLEDSPGDRSQRQPARSLPSSSLGRLTVFGTRRWHLPVIQRRAPRFIVVRGAPGVGKSTVACNVALALAELRIRVALLDFDLLRPSLHRLFGVEAPPHGLEALLDRDVDTLEEALTQTPVRNLHVIAATRPADASAFSTAEHLDRLLARIFELGIDLVIADLGSSAWSAHAAAAACGGLSVTVTTGNPAALNFATDLCTTEVLQNLRQLGLDEGSAGRLAHAMLVAPQIRLHELVRDLAPTPEMRARVESALAGLSARLVGNAAVDAGSTAALEALSSHLAERLGIKAPVLGNLELSEQLTAAERAGRPLLLGRGVDRNVRTFHTIAEQLLSEVPAGGPGAAAPVAHVP